MHSCFVRSLSACVAIVTGGCLHPPSPWPPSPSPITHTSVDLPLQLCKFHDITHVHMCAMTCCASVSSLLHRLTRPAVKRWNAPCVRVRLPCLPAASSSRHVTETEPSGERRRTRHSVPVLEWRPRGRWRATRLRGGDSSAVASSSSSPVCCCASSTRWLWRPGCRSCGRMAPSPMTSWKSTFGRWWRPMRRRRSPRPAAPNLLRWWSSTGPI